VTRPHRLRTLLALSACLLGSRLVAQSRAPIEIETTLHRTDRPTAGLAGDETPELLVELSMTGVSGLTGLGLRLHFDARILQFAGLEYEHAPGLIGHQLRRDVTDADGDPATDTYLVIGWMDSEARWPATGGARRTLLRARFERVAAGETIVRVTSPTLPPDRSFEPKPVRVAP
jgi:hypothetical protein